MVTEIPVLETDRLILRGLELRDAPIVQKLAGAPEVASTTLNIPHPYPEGAAAEFIQRTQERARTGDDYAFAMTRKEDGEFLGIVGLHPEERHNQAEIGYWLGKPYWGNGYTAEAAKAVIRFGFTQLGLNRIFAGHFLRNPASGRVMQKAGMQYEGTHRQAMKKGDGYEDIVMYAILASDMAGEVSVKEG
jgi:RimJ/RimL family protein N-acetyltransferase